MEHDMSEKAMEHLLHRALEYSAHTQKELNSLDAKIKSAGGSAEAYTAAGRINEYANHLTSAAYCYRAAIHADSHAYEAKARLAIVELKSNLNEQALATISQLCLDQPEFKFYTLDGTPTSATTVLADALRANRKPNVLETYAKAMEIEPKDGYAKGCYAESLISVGRLKDATALEGSIPDTDNFAAIRSTLRLANNDPKQLPALLGLNHQAFQVAKHV